MFGQVTGALLDAQNVGAKGRSLIDAIDWNRRLWSTLAVDCMDESNRLPPPFAGEDRLDLDLVTKYSSQVMQQGVSLEPLIDVNRTIMQGLQGTA